MTIIKCPVRLVQHTLVALMLLTATLAFAQTHTPADQHVVTAWTMSPSTLPPSADAEDSFNNQTIRQTVRLSAGGDRIRLRISNQHGDRPLNIGALTVARQIEGSSLDMDSIQSVTVNGEAAFVIPRGAILFSDVINYPVSAFENLSLNIFLPQRSGPATTHRLSVQSAWVSPGNTTLAPDLPPGTQAISFWHYVTAIDVFGSDAVSTIVTVGDSITDGWGSSDDAHQRWPDIFAQRLRTPQGMPVYAVANAGLSGNRVLHEQSPNFGENLLARFERDVLALSNVSHIVLLEGINDIGMSVSAPQQTVSAEQIIGGYQQVIARAKARGIKVIGATLTPFEGAAYFHEEGERKRQQINNWIRTSGAFDGVIDFERAVQDPANPRRLRAEFTADNLHPNDAGYKAMADIIDLELFR